MASFPSRLKEAMCIRRMSGAELARRMDVARSTVSQWSTGKYDVTNAKIMEMGIILDVSPEWLFGANVPFVSYAEYSKQQVETDLDDQLIKKLLQLNESNKQQVRGFIEGLLYSQTHK